jgi:hypothetical protein
MGIITKHPMAAGIVLGAVIGIVLAPQISKLPLVNKIPQV